MLNVETAETRVKRLADALRAATMPLLRLREHADDLEKLVSAQELIQASCVAALIRAEALKAEVVLGHSLQAVEEAAEGLVTA
jgi:hypothetical protein